VNNYFGKFNKDGLLIKPSENFIQAKPELLIKVKKTDQAHLVIGTRGNPIATKTVMWNRF